jgi:hypothetical protein
LFSITQDVKKTEHLGDLEIGVGPSTPAKTVTSHGEWVTAWDPTVKATTYVLPHCHSKLRRYGKYILQLFSAMPTEQHARIISFDKAIGVRVAQCRDLLLTDFAEFVDLQMHWIQSTAGSTSNKGGQKPKGEQGRQSIRKWEPSIISMKDNVPTPVQRATINMSVQSVKTTATQQTNVQKGDRFQQWLLRPRYA